MVKRKKTMKENLGIDNYSHLTNKPSAKPIDILKMRLARGEITKEEYKELYEMVD
jgi:uncharacterized membrane protein